MNFYAFFCCEMFLVICRRCQLSDGDDDGSDGRERLRLVCKGSRDTPTLPARLSLTALSLFLFARALSLSRHSEVRSLFLPISHSLSLPFVLFCANCLQHFLNASWSQHLKHFNLLLLSRSMLLLSHALSSLTLSPSLSLSLLVCKVCSAFVKMAASAVRALSLWGLLLLLLLVETLWNWNSNLPRFESGVIKRFRN